MTRLSDLAGPLASVGYVHSIDGSAVKHIHDRHDSQEKKEKHG
jgi:hypothetical protein